MARRRIDPVVRAGFVELVCGGWSIARAADLVGVSRGTGFNWWAASGLMLMSDASVAPGAVGGLAGSVPSNEPGATGPDERGEEARVRRPLTYQDRATIAVALICRVRPARIAVMLGRGRSVICREIARNTGPDGSYDAHVAHRAAHERRRRPKPFKLVTNGGLCRRIETWMDQGWSPGLIAAMLRHEHPGQDVDARMCRVSHETIYQALYVQTRGSLRRDLAKNLARGRRARKPRGAADGRGKSLYREAFKISQRPPEVADRAVPGHWEGDLILGTGNGSAVGTLVERSTRFVMLLHLPGTHDAESVAAAMIDQMSRLPDHLRKSLTWDRGTEMARWRDIQLALDMPIYFADPHSPWQRGSNENTNGLLRFWLTKGTDLSTFTPADLDRIAHTLNARPRPTLNLKTPAQALAELLEQPAA